VSETERERGKEKERRNDLKHGKVAARDTEILKSLGPTYLSNSDPPR
jgi:hypothetical protein